MSKRDREGEGGGGGGPPQQPRRQPRRTDSGSDEEEPEGEDLFGEDYEKDYLAPDSSDDGRMSSLASFIDSDGNESEASDGVRRRAEQMLEQRHRVERAIAAEREREEAEGGSELSFGGGWDDDEDGVDEEGEEGADGGDTDGAGASTSRGGGGGAMSAAAAGAGTSRGWASEGSGREEEHDVFRQGEIAGSGDFDWRKPHGEVCDWLQQDQPRRVIRNRVYNFLLNFTQGTSQVYVERVRAMTRANGESFEVSYMHLGEVYASTLALWLVDAPELMLELLDEAANYLVYHALFPHYSHVRKRVRVRIAELPLVDPIRDFRQTHRDVLVRVEGVVIRRSPVYPQLQAVRYDCSRCSFVIGPIMQRSDREVRVTQCPSCQGKGPFRINMAQTEYRSHQTIVVQEPPGKVPPGRLPRSLEAILTHDLIDTARPGEHVEIIGTYKNTFDPLLNSRQGFPVFTTILQANNVTCKSAGGDTFALPEDERQKIVNLARDPRIKRKLMASMAPSIHGRDDIKLGLLLALLGGVAKDVGGDRSHKIRGDLNCLLVGDPGTAKSQCLKFVEKVADRAVFTTGRGSTAVGLTASVSKDAVTGDFTLEGGALVVADKGVCLIDEFDKMSDQDRTSIHEAMEQQTISVARGGIVTTLSARCSVIAAANPIGGRYDPSLSFDANVDLTTPILSRFDLLFVVRDEVHTEEDTRLARFICHSHQRSHPVSRAEARQVANERRETLHDLSLRLRAAATDAEREAIESEMARIAGESQGVTEDEDPSTMNPLPQSLLKKYIMYAKTNCRPMIARVDGDTLAKVYTDLRQESKRGGIPITVRHMESIIRLSEAHARIYLRDFVANDDVNAAIALFLRCFLNSQKYRLRQELEQEFRKFLDADVEPLHLLHHKLRHLVHQARVWERRVSGIEPTTVEVATGEFEAQVATMRVAVDAVSAYYVTEEFQREFELVKDGSGIPVAIRHTVV
jgi:DNA replication licensing factor MCM2